MIQLPCSSLRSGRAQSTGVVDEYAIEILNRCTSCYGNRYSGSAIMSSLFRIVRRLKEWVVQGSSNFADFKTTYGNTKILTNKAQKPKYQGDNMRDKAIF